MSKKNKENLDALLNEALANARKDRNLTLEAFEEMKVALRLETDEDLRKAMLVGEKPIKLLEQLTRSNEQIVRLAQLRERQDSRKKDDARKPLDLSQLSKIMEEEEEELGESSVNIRVKNE